MKGRKYNADDMKRKGKKKKKTQISPGLAYMEVLTDGELPKDNSKQKGIEIDIRNSINLFYILL